MSLFYILKGRLPVPVDIFEWGAWSGDEGNRRVAETTVAEGFWVSTIFLGIDHSFGSETPLLFETMVFSTDTDDEAWFTDAEGANLQWRYSNWIDAEKGHAAIVANLERWISSLTDPKIRPIAASSETNQGGSS